ncbi:MAG TPA: glucosidase, partial [Polyangiaceae bacterium]|nr:glucosidase [Polyangiaceae bacterium]
MEKSRLAQADEKGVPWRQWGPYLSERQWGTVREDYSQGGNAWDYLTHEAARSHVYRWGEDGLGGISDDQQRLCFALALWNGKDPILKERAFGLTNSEGNHGEDVKEYYFYLDNTPTHSYMKYLYKYPQAAFPYTDLVATNRSRTRRDFEYELLDTGIFDEDRYFDVFVEYAKASPEEILVEITVANRGPEAATLHVLPTLWFRNTWSRPFQSDGPLPELRPAESPAGMSVIRAHHAELGDWYLYGKEAELLFCDNESNIYKHPAEQPSTNYYKDGIHEYVVHGNREALRPGNFGTKASFQYVLEVPAGGESKLRLRLCKTPPDAPQLAAARQVFLGAAFEQVLTARRDEADQFYTNLAPKALSAEEKRVYRQALAGMLWSK